MPVEFSWSFDAGEGSGYLRLNGVDIPVSMGAKFEPIRVGDSGRSLNGTARRSWRASKREWTFTTIPLLKADADAVRGLVDGAGHHFPFDADKYSDKGLGVASDGGAVAGSSPSPKYGAGRIKLSVSAGVEWDFAPTAASYSAILWANYDSGGWKHTIVCSDGSKFQDGVQNNSLDTSFLWLAGNSVTLAGISGVQSFDDLVWVPYLIPSGWVSDLYTFASSSAFSALPKLVGTGTFAGGETLSVLGEVTGAEPMTMPGGDIYETVEFSLKEV